MIEKIEEQLNKLNGQKVALIYPGGTGIILTGKRETEYKELIKLLEKTKPKIFFYRIMKEKDMTRIDIYIPELNTRTEIII